MKAAVYITLLVVIAASAASPHKRSRQCEVASVALKRLIQEQHDWFEYFRTAMPYEVFFEGATGATLDQFPDNVMCPYEGVTNFEEFFTVLDQQGHAIVLFRFLYKYLTFTALMMDYQFTNELENPHPWLNRESKLTYLQLLDAIKASGTLNYDPEGLAFMTGLIAPLPISLPSEDELSTDPIDVQVDRIVAAIRQVWNMNIKQMSSYMPGQASQYVRNVVYQHTGIELPQNPQPIFTALVSDILATKDSDHPVASLYGLLVERDILQHILKSNLPNLVDFLLRSRTREPEDSEVKPATFQTYCDFVDAVNQMGLLHPSSNK